MAVFNNLMIESPLLLALNPAPDVLHRKSEENHSRTKMDHGQRAGCDNSDRVRLSDTQFLWAGDKRAISIVGASAAHRKAGGGLEHTGTAQKPIGTAPEPP